MMVARKAEKVYREILHATGKVDGKAHKWVVGVFANERMLRAYHGLLTVAYKTADAELVKALDPHAPTTDTSGPATDVKFSKTTVQYNPEAPGLDDAAALG